MLEKLNDIKAGVTVVYFIGELSKTLSDKSVVNANYIETLKIKNAAYKLFIDGRAHLFQYKLDRHRFAYIAVGRRCAIWT